MEECPPSEQVLAFQKLGIAVAVASLLVSVFMFWWLQSNFGVFWGSAVSPKTVIKLGELPLKVRTWNKGPSITVFILTILSLICCIVGTMESVIGSHKEDLKKRIWFFLPSLITAVLILCIAVISGVLGNLKHMSLLVIFTTVVMTLTIFLFILALL
jgi:hypothetical protein